MRYTIKYYSAIFEENIPLISVVDSMARHAATGYGNSKLGVHGPTLKNAQRNFTELLIDAANNGALTVCDSTGRTGSVEKVASRSVLPEVQDGFSTSERAIYGLYARAKHLLDWGAANGYEFEFQDMPAHEVVSDLKDEDGKIIEKGFYRGYIGTEQKEPSTYTTRRILGASTELTASTAQAALVSNSVAPGIPAAPTQSNASENGKAKVRGGRPAVKHKKTAILRQIIGAMTAGKTVNTGALPGSAADLLDACRRIEQAQTRKTAIFGGATAPGTFNTWLQDGGFHMKVGRTPHEEKTYWTDLLVETMGKMPPNIFRGVSS